MMGYQSFVNARQGHLYQHLPLPLPHQQQKSIHYFENEKTYIYIYRERERERGKVNRCLLQGTIINAIFII